MQCFSFAFTGAKVMPRQFPLSEVTPVIEQPSFFFPKEFKVHVFGSTTVYISPLIWCNNSWDFRLIIALVNMHAVDLRCCNFKES